MTDPTQTPILVSQSPVPAQFMAGVRQIMALVSAVLGALGLAHYLPFINDPAVVTGLGFAAWGVFFLWGQVATRINAKRLAIAAEHAPNEIAQIK